MKTDTRPYAEALLQSTKDPLNTDHDLHQLASVISRLPILKHVLVGASLEPAMQRQATLDETLGDFSPLLRRLVDGLLSEGLLDALPAIAVSYRLLLKQEHHVSEVLIETPRALTAGEEKALVETVVAKDQQRIITQSIKPELLGGVRLVVDDVEYDRSLGGALQRLQSNLAPAA